MSFLEASYSFPCDDTYSQITHIDDGARQHATFLQRVVGQDVVVGGVSAPVFSGSLLLAASGWDAVGMRVSQHDG